MPKDKKIIPLYSRLRVYEAQTILKGAGLDDIQFIDSGIEACPYELSQDLTIMISLGLLFKGFLKLGATAYGGPAIAGQMKSGKSFCRGENCTYNYSSERSLGA